MSTIAALDTIIFHQNSGIKINYAPRINLHPVLRKRYFQVFSENAANNDDETFCYEHYTSTDLSPIHPLSKLSSNMPKAPASSSKPRHTPLHVALDEDRQLEKFGRVKTSKTGRGGNGKGKGKSRSGENDDEDVGDQEGRVENSRMSKKILDLARDQQDEVAKELGKGDDWEDEEDEDVDMRGGP